ncbi:MAG: MATE family efflux transporter [Clostridia bacterium]|nr:MATE family efflux transporter [Clostridia bacterium]
MNRDLTQGGVTRAMLLFAAPMILGNLLQQGYNIADTWIVGHYLGPDALAAVGSSFSLMTFLTSILLGLCMGCGALFSIHFGRRDERALSESIGASFLLIAVLTGVLTLLSFLLLNAFGTLMNVPDAVWGYMRRYLAVIFLGIPATFLFNYFASLLRALGNATVPLIFLACSAVLNIALDLLLILAFDAGVGGAAAATVIAQYLSGLSLMLYTYLRFPALRIRAEHLHPRLALLRTVISFSGLTCLQQSVMNLGILMVQGRVNAFGATVMTAFAAAVKIDAFAYMPVQDFGNAFSTFIAQNYGAGRSDRIRRGFRSAVTVSVLFSLAVSAAVCIFAEPLMTLFVEKTEVGILYEGVRYLRIEGAFYFGIGLLFLLYGLYRAVAKPWMSVVLTVISLGTRVLLAYTLSAIPAVGVVGIWWSVPIGWILADLTGFAVYYVLRKTKRIL